MKTINVPFNGKGRKISYKVEMIDLSQTPLQFVNVYAVFIDDPELQAIVGEHFTILHNQLQLGKPVYDIRNPGDINESNLKKAIAQQIMNNPGE
jgi:hypothetical protein